MPKLGVEDLKALLAEAEEAVHEDVDVSHLAAEEDDGSSYDGSHDDSRHRSSSISESDTSRKAKKSTAQMTRELTDLYRHAIAQTSDGALGYDDIKSLVSSFAGIEPSEAQMRGIMAELDEDGDGDVSESEWVNFCLKQLVDYVNDAGDEAEENVNKKLTPFAMLVQQWNEIEGRATQIIIDKDITDKYETIQLEMKVGQVLFFDGHLAHQSGHNSTKDEIRLSLVGMWNDVSHEGFRAPLPSFESRTISAKEYFSVKMRGT